jgi:hypothetical protein
MTRNPSQPPTNHRDSRDPWGDLDYLCKKVRYWLYTRRRNANAKRYQGRLKQALRKLPENNRAILREEGLALLCELEGKIGEAIAHRKREIRLMERLHREAESPEVCGQHPRVHAA